MTPQHALSAICHALTKLNRSQQRLGQAALQDADLTTEQRANEIRWRLTYIVDIDADMEILEAAGAHLVALMLAVDEAQTPRIETGAEA